MKILRIAIADDHSIVRTGVRQLLEAQPHMEVVAEAPNGPLLLKQVKQLRPDVVVVDISMPKLSGLEMIPLIRDACKETQVVILTMYKKEAYAYQALSVGAMGYVLKTAPSEELLEAIELASVGRYFLSPEINAEVIQSYLNKDEAPIRQQAISKYDLLSEREQQVLRLYFGIGEDTNHTLDEIGQKLDITRERVRQIKEKAIQKLKRSARSGKVKRIEGHE